MAQYETEPALSYFESYVDDIIQNVNGVRMKVASNVQPDGVFSGSYGLFSRATLLSQYLCYQTSSFTVKNSTVRSRAFNSKNRIYDTLVPSLDDIMTTDGAAMVLTSAPTPGVTYVRYRYFFGGYFYDPVTSIGRMYTVTSSAGTQLSNNKWLTSFPFENRYKSLQRKTSGLDDLLSRTYKASGSYGNSSGLAPTFYDTMPRNATSSLGLSEAPIDIFWGGGTRPIAVTPSVVFTYYFPSGSDATATRAGAMYNGVEDYTGTVTAGGGFTGYPTVGGEVPDALPSQTYSNTMKHAFGFGNGQKNVVEPYATGFVFVSSIPHRIMVGARISGWKYGLYSALAANPGCRYRIGKYGQPRDMLEQRIYTKEISADFRTTDSPIKIEFVAGTQAALTASNQTLNVNDSGIYDVEYRSGHPYKD